MSNESTLPTVPKLTPKAQLYRRFSHLVRSLPPVEKKEDLDVWYVTAAGLRERLHSDFAELYPELPHEFEHYLDDADIRLKDPGYREHQEETILRPLLQMIQSQIHAGRIAEPIQRGTDNDGAAPHRV